MFERYLSEQARVDESRRVSEGVLLGEWQVTAFLGRGGSGEVYRVINRMTGQEAAAKVLLRSDIASQHRFREEIEFLRDNTLPQFPRFYAMGVYEGCPFLVQELLSPVEVGGDDRSVAAYLIAVAECVAALHRAGFVHRDLKPKNVMRRATGEIVLIDFGLVKNVASSPLPRKDISIASEKVVAVGTPRYAAPEQMLEGVASEAADIHALGRMANAAFDGHPPRCWTRIIRNATSTIPEQRYQTVEDFIAAIRRRHLREYIVRSLGGVGMLGTLLASIFLYWRNGGSEVYLWQTLQEQAVVPIVEQRVLSEMWETNELGRAICIARTFRNVTNEVELTFIRLNGMTNVFARPLILKGERTYRIIGPGVLDAKIVSAESNVTLRLKDCVLRNRTTVPLAEAGIRYVFEGSAFLEFPMLDRVPLNATDEFVDFDGAFNRVRFKNDKL